MDFTRPNALADAMKGASVLYNTYWVRFNYGDFSFSKAVENTKVLLEAAKAAGVHRIVHISITNPSRDSPLEYFRGKALVEDAVASSLLSYAILRPAVIYGDEGILINNIAYLLRRLPVFPVFGDGSYRLQPIFVDDLAALMVGYGKGHANLIVDAIGPDTLSYREMVALIGRAMGCPRAVVRTSDWAGSAFSSMMGWFTRDVLITRDEIRGLKANLLWTESPPAGTTRLSDWLRENAEWLGRRYMSELCRRGA
jgi:NADH dehydrogenase